VSLSWNEIRDRAVAFSREWGDATSERAEAQSFCNDFFKVFGVNRKRVAIFEKQVEIARAGKKLKNGRIDAFWKGVLLIANFGYMKVAMGYCLFGIVFAVLIALYWRRHLWQSGAAANLR